MRQPAIAIVGASADQAKFGNKCVRAYLQKGWTVYPVHPGADVIEGCPVFRAVRDIPISQLQRVSMYLPKAAGLSVLDNLAGISIDELWLNPGADDPAVVEKAEQLGLNVVCACAIVAIGVDPHRLD